MNELIRKLEAAPCGSRELDAEISMVARGYGFDTELRQLYGPAYTTSLDAAMSLVPEGWVIVDVCQRLPCLHQWEWAVRLGVLEDGAWRYVRGCSAKAPGSFALALCIASLKAAGYE